MKGDTDMSDWREELNLSDETEKNIIVDILNWKRNLYVAGFDVKVLGWKVAIEWEEMEYETN
jgi:hypothetical protein